MAFKKFKMLKSKEGISPILATLLLIVIAVAAISVTYAWIMTYTNSTTEKAGVLLYEANVNYVSSGNVTIDIGNSGTSDAKIITVYAGASESSMQSYTPNYVGTYTSTVTAGGITRFYITLSYSTSTQYYFRVVPSSGTALTFNQKSPSA
jgi:flagellin-like protein